jgi:hypothetical protein
MVLTTDDSLEALLAETVAAAEQCLRDMKGEAAPPPPPPPAPSLKPWCGACELAGDGLCVAAGCAVANGSVAFYDADQAASTPVLSVACDAVAASYALRKSTGAVTFRADDLAYSVHFEDSGDVAGFCRAVAAAARATRIFELRASADERVVQREDLFEVAVKVYRGGELVLDDPDAACAADGSVEPVPGLGLRVVGARRGGAIGMLIGDRWVEAVIGHIAGGDVVEDPPLLEKEVIEERVVTPPPKIRPVSLDAARRQLDELLLRAKEGEAEEDPRVAELLKERDVLRSKLRGNEDALAKLRAFMENLKKPRRMEEPEIPPAARAWKAEVDAEVACSKAAMAAEQARLAARNASVWAAVPAPREMVPVNGPIADALLRSIAFDLEVLERRGSAADHARYLDGLRAVLRREEGRRDLF